MSLRDQARQWAKQHTDQLRSDPKRWAKTQQERLRKAVDVAPFSDAALGRELGDLRERMGRLEQLDGDARQALGEALIDLHGRLSPGGALVSGAKIGLAAAVLPVIGMVTGPILGSAYGVYRSQQLTEARDEVLGMLRALSRG